MKKVIAWVTPWERTCGISDYSRALWPAVNEAIRAEGYVSELISIDQYAGPEALAQRLGELSPELIHFQHEYGLFGGKNPPRYWFPKLLAQVRSVLPRSRLCATGHTILPPDYRFPVQGRAWQAPVRLAANFLALPYLKEFWGRKTWSLDGVIVHSRHQVGIVSAGGARLARAIPHFVPDPFPRGGALGEIPGFREVLAGARRKIVVFGFFTPEKGQDVAIEATPYLPEDTVLILAGGVRRGKDHQYHERCVGRILELGLKERVFITGFLDRKYVADLYAVADLVLVPFRETSGSGSVATAIAHDVPILASDLLLNRELGEREPGGLEFFKSENPEDCARVARELLESSPRRQALAEGARRYRERYCVKRIAEEHALFYKAVLS